MACLWCSCPPSRTFQIVFTSLFILLLPVYKLYESRSRRNRHSDRSRPLPFSSSFSLSSVPHSAIPHFAVPSPSLSSHCDGLQPVTSKKSYPKSSVHDRALVQSTDPKRLQKPDPPPALTATTVYVLSHVCDRSNICSLVLVLSHR